MDTTTKKKFRELIDNHLEYIDAVIFDFLDNGSCDACDDLVYKIIQLSKFRSNLANLNKELKDEVEELERKEQIKYTVEQMEAKRHD